MKRFTKIMLMISLICFLLGTGITLAALAMGGGHEEAIRGENEKSEATLTERIPVEERWQKLEISVQAGRILIVQEEDLDSVEVRDISGHINFRKEQEEDSLELEFSRKPGTHHWLAGNQIAAVVAIPADHDFDRISLDVDAGAVEMTLAGSMKDYNYNMNINAGSVKIGSNEFAGWNYRQKLQHDEAEKEIRLDCDAGRIELKFEN